MKKESLRRKRLQEKYQTETNYSADCVTSGTQSTKFHLLSRKAIPEYVKTGNGVHKVQCTTNTFEMQCTFCSRRGCLRSRHRAKDRYQPKIQMSFRKPAAMECLTFDDLADVLEFQRTVTTTHRFALYYLKVLRTFIQKVEYLVEMFHVCRAQRDKN